MSVGCKVCKIVPAASAAATDPDTTKNEIRASSPLTSAAAAAPKVSTIATAAPTPVVPFGLEAAEKVTVSPATYPDPGLLTTQPVEAPPPATVKSIVKPTPATEVVAVGATFKSTAAAVPAELVVISPPPVSYTHLTLPTNREV